MDWVSTFEALFPLRRSLRCTVRKSMLKRVRPEVFGTVECICAAEKRMAPPGSVTSRTCGSSSIGSSGLSCGRVSLLMCCAALARLVLFHS